MIKMIEIWKDIIDYPNYQVSNLGNVKNIKTNKILKPFSTAGEYLKVSLSKNGKARQFFIHRLVATAFIPNPNNYLYINHKDENPKNNVVNNLEWCTMTYNNTYGHRLEKVRKKVAQYNLQGDLIKVWNSFMEIERELGYSNSSINSCCKGKRKHVGGYIWKYN